MTTLLAIDTATDACSLALQVGDERRAVHRVIPRQHQQSLFAFLDELLDGRVLRELGLDAVVFGRGPGSFTGLRIAASFAQGLAYSLQVPVIGLSTLEVQARSYLRREGLCEPSMIVSAIDARIGEIYSAVYRFDGQDLELLSDPAVTVPESLAPPAAGPLPLHAVGSGFVHRAAMPGTWDAALATSPDTVPEALDMLAPAAAALRAGSTLAPAAALPDYVQERIAWKTLAEQGRRP